MLTCGFRKEGESQRRISTHELFSLQRYQIRNKLTFIWKEEKGTVAIMRTLWPWLARFMSKFGKTSKYLFFFVIQSYVFCLSVCAPACLFPKTKSLPNLNANEGLHPWVVKKICRNFWDGSFPCFCAHHSVNSNSLVPARVWGSVPYFQN